jgi:electron transport complex protein RnfG
MKEMVRYGFTLALICIVATGLLAGVNHFTRPRIIAQAQAEEDASLREVFPEATSFEPVKATDEVIYYKAYDKNKAFLGAAFKAQGKGYSSVIETIAGMTKDGKIIAIKIINHNETPGLGSRVAEPAFTNQFRQINSQDLTKVQAISGATISSKAVKDSVEKKVEEIKALIKDDK